MMTWEELMGMMSTAGYDIWTKDATETPNYPIFTNGGRHFKPHSNYPISTNGGRYFKPQSIYQTPTYGGRHFKSQTNDPTSTNGGDTSNPTFGDRQLDRSLGQIYPTNIH